MMLGKEGVDLVSQLAGQASGKGPTRDRYWGELVTKTIPRAAMGPLVDRLKTTFVRSFAARGGASFLGKALPFGIGAAVGGAGNHILGRRVLVGSRRAFGLPPLDLPADLEPRPDTLRLEHAATRGIRRAGGAIAGGITRGASAVGSAGTSGRRGGHPARAEGPGRIGNGARAPTGHPSATEDRRRHGAHRRLAMRRVTPDASAQWTHGSIQHETRRADASGRGCPSEPARAAPGGGVARRPDRVGRLADVSGARTIESVVIPIVRSSRSLRAQPTTRRSGDAPARHARRARRKLSGARRASACLPTRHLSPPGHNLGGMDSTLACLAAWMPRQRWYAAKGRPPSLRLVAWWDPPTTLPEDATSDDTPPEGTEARVRTFLVADEGALPAVLYQIPVVSRATATVDASPDHIIGSPEPGTTFIDGPFDPAYTSALLGLVTRGGQGIGPRSVATGHPTRACRDGCRPHVDRARRRAVEHVVDLPVR